MLSHKGSSAHFCTLLSQPFCSIPAGRFCFIYQVRECVPMWFKVHLKRWGKEPGGEYRMCLSATPGGALKFSQVGQIWRDRSRLLSRSWSTLWAQTGSSPMQLGLSVKCPRLLKWELQEQSPRLVFQELTPWDSNCLKSPSPTQGSFLEGKLSYLLALLPWSTLWGACSF